MCERKCEDMRNLDAMHRSIMTAISCRTAFFDEDDARVFYDVACQFLSSVLFAKYRRERECPLMSEQE